MTDFEKYIGKKGERLAARTLKKKGFRILARNFRAGHNELDIIAKNKELLIFVEVKSRSFERVEQAAIARPAFAVDPKKRKRTMDAAYAYLNQNPTRLPIRMDVVEVFFDRSRHPKLLKLCHIEDAFGADGSIR